jgi:hypothetical protein
LRLTLYDRKEKAEDECYSPTIAHGKQTPCAPRR